MRKLLAVVLLSLVACGAASARLTPKESRWVKPVVATWTSMNAGLDVVLKEASAPNALAVGSPNNGKLTATLATFVSCASQLKKQGAPPTARLRAFAATMQKMCVHMTRGANDLAKAIGAKSAAVAKRDVNAMNAEWGTATTYLKQARTQITRLGRK